MFLKAISSTCGFRRQPCRQDLGLLIVYTISNQMENILTLQNALLQNNNELWNGPKQAQLFAYAGAVETLTENPFSTLHGIHLLGSVLAF